MPVVALALIAVGMLNNTVDATAAEIVKTETSGVIYVQYSEDIHDECWGKEAPQYAEVDLNGVGYLFGGWYAKNGDVYTPIESEDALANATTVVAKFVPAQTLSVKCQNWAGTDKNSDNVIVRMISATDSTNYKGYGFVVSKIVGGVEKVLGTTADNTKDVYSRFNYYKNADDETPTATYIPSQLFGNAANHFISSTVGRIPTGAHNAIICIKPFWDTLDGVRVYGLSKFAHVEDGYLGYVNVPVNLNILKNGCGATAGMLSVQSDDDLTFIGAENGGIECGKVFDEMEFNVAQDENGKTIIRCIGNMEDISEKEEMDIYVNLKYQRKEIADETPIIGDYYTFSVTGEDFCDADENSIPDENVWNVIY